MGSNTISVTYSESSKSTLADHRLAKRFIAGQRWNRYENPRNGRPEMADIWYPPSAVRYPDCDLMASLIPPMNRWATIIRPLTRTGTGCSGFKRGQAQAGRADKSRNKTLPAYVRGPEMTQMLQCLPAGLALSYTQPKSATP